MYTVQRKMTWELLYDKNNLEKVFTANYAGRG